MTVEICKKNLLPNRPQPGVPLAAERNTKESRLANGKVYAKQIYAGADHAFHNDTSPRYNAEAARDAWARTLAWFDHYL